MLSDLQALIAKALTKDEPSRTPWFTDDTRFITHNGATTLVLADHFEKGDLAADQTLQEVSRTVLELQASGQRYHDLVLDPGALVPGGTYKFLLTATLTPETGATTEGYASVV